MQGQTGKQQLRHLAVFNPEARRQHGHYDPYQHTRQLQAAEPTQAALQKRWLMAVLAMCALKERFVYWRNGVLHF